LIYETIESIFGTCIVSVIPFLDRLISIESQVVIRPWCLSWRGARNFIPSSTPCFFQI